MRVIIRKSIFSGSCKDVDPRTVMEMYSDELPNVYKSKVQRLDNVSITGSITLATDFINQRKNCLF